MWNKSQKNLDEMQEQKLLKLEEYGFWVMFWALTAAIAVQLIAGGTIKEAAGELIVLLIGSVYISITSLRNGIWTKKTAPTRKGNAIASLIPAIAIGALNGIKLFHNGKTDACSVMIAAAIAAAAYLACFAVLELFRTAYNKQRAKLDGAEDESEE